MGKPKLYLFIGYPGAGKTTVSRFITTATGGAHLWADVERHRLFKRPSHSEAESRELYDRLNRQAGDLLAAGKDVVYDTNFNFYDDRQRMRQIAAHSGAETVLVWITVPKRIARQRAVHAAEIRNGYEFSMSQEQFDAITTKLESPREDEKFIKISGLKLDKKQVLTLLNL